MKSCRLILAAILALSLLANGCQKPPTSTFAPAPPDVAELRQSLEGFTLDILPRALAQPSEAENACISPISLYMALGMCQPSLADGAQRQALQSQLFGQQSPTVVESQLPGLLEYLNSPGPAQLSLANGAWLRPDHWDSLADDALPLLKQQYGAQLHRAELDQATTKEIEKWIAQNTQDLLAPTLKPSADALAIYVNTLYFAGLWETPFDPAQNTWEDFATPLGPKPCTFMNKNYTTLPVWSTLDYSGARLPMENGATLSFVLPAPGGDPLALLQDAQIAQSILYPKNLSQCGVALKLPKFSFGTTRDLSHLFPQAPNRLLQVCQGTFVQVDEQGAKAAAYTTTTAPTAAPATQLLLLLDRPFLFTLHAPDGTLLLAGLVQNPSWQS